VSCIRTQERVYNIRECKGGKGREDKEEMEWQGKVRRRRKQGGDGWVRKESLAKCDERKVERERKRQRGLKKGMGRRKEERKREVASS